MWESEVCYLLPAEEREESIATRVVLKKRDESLSCYQDAADMRRLAKQQFRLTN